MFHKSRPILLVLALAVLGVMYMPCFHSSDAAQPRERQPFANAVEQRMEIVRELQETNRLLKQQNELLRAALGRPAAAK